MKATVYIRPENPCTEDEEKEVHECDGFAIGYVRHGVDDLPMLVLMPCGRDGKYLTDGKGGHLRFTFPAKRTSIVLE